MQEANHDPTDSTLGQRKSKKAAVVALGGLAIAFGLATLVEGGRMLQDFVLGAQAFALATLLRHTEVKQPDAA